LLFNYTITFSQEQTIAPATGNKGKLYAYWGWNQDWFSNSNIHFEGPNYNFTLDKVQAWDNPASLTADNYANPVNMTIPQFNARIGYFIHDKYNISIGTDHMKYVVRRHQTSQITGNINSTGTSYDDSYQDEKIIVADSFLLFEHTDGLNYINSEFRRVDQLHAFQNISFNATEGVGAAVLLPKTNATVLNTARYDEYHISGYGLHALVGINATFYNTFFLQSELKTGFINMPDIKTSADGKGKASQHFFFYQLNFVLGAGIQL